MHKAPAPGERFLAVHVREAEVEHHGVGGFLADLAQAGSRVVGAHRLIARRIQGGFQEPVDLRFVIDDEDSGWDAVTEILGADRLGETYQQARAAGFRHRAHRRDAAAHGLHETLGDGETQPRALAAVGGDVEAAELVEHPLQLAARDAAALILDGDHHRVRSSCAATSIRLLSGL